LEEGIALELAVIAPFECLAHTQQQKYHMVLPQLLGQGVYQEFYTTRPKNNFIMLDNGEAEGVKVKTRDLMKCAELIGANEVVVPDVMGDCNGTMERVVKFKRTAFNNPQYKYMGVVQGQTYAEIAKIIMWYGTQDWITTLGLPRWLSDHVEHDMRITIMRGLGIAIQDGFEAVHALGGARWFREAVHLSEYPVRSLDTSLPHVMAIEGKNILFDGYQARQKEFFWKDLDGKQRLLATQNITNYEAWCQGRGEG
jgi:hypothetical protein